MASFIVNALQVNFESVLSMEDAGMVSMLRSLEKSGFRRFFGVLGSVFEEALTQFYANASMIVGTITYMKYDSKIFRQEFYKKMNEVVTSINTSQTALETNLVRQFEESHQHFASEMALVKLQLAELVNHLKEISDAKKGEGESSKKRRLM
ncbi:acyl-CoA-binding domain-containing protein 4-like [Dorcoceras hygrometricum]|uniref:Acyl-CoA-binding domain-containing protein 4-like n=1 Tax=Dorcoceras hygrometricum TaxID=472368 RepID=A0A2Z7CQR3_9LAMI|nr:acyl-CoA-binding domain-containing protein 4-like [Dorcoceras hygrometricum]